VGRRLLRGTVKLGIIAAVIGGLVFVGKKLMGGLGPEPGSASAPKEWPSLVPDPVAEAPSAATANGSDNGSDNGADNGASAEPAEDAGATTD
jgi:hypothetical protein